MARLSEPAPPPEELTGPPVVGRVFRARTFVELGDGDARGRLRLDGAARLLQHLSSRDVADAGITDPWVLRRMVLRCDGDVRVGDPLETATWASGLGPRWAERRSTLTGPAGRLDAAALWVHVAPDTGAPAPLPDRFVEQYAAAAGGRRVRARLHHPPPPPGAESCVWPLRAVDVDLLGHVHNVAYWAAFEELRLGRSAPPPRPRAAEIEFRGGIDLGDDVTLRHAWQWGRLDAWLCVAGEVRASAVVEVA